MKYLYVFRRVFFMRIFSKCCLFLLSLTLLLASIPISALAEAGEVLSLSAKSAIVIEANSGAVIHSKNADAPLPMASTTKLMTAWTAVALASPDRIITVPPEAVGIEGSSVYLVAGEQLTLKDLLYALLLSSANDAATAIAIGLCGSIPAFAEEMNRQAEALELSSTRFQNPHGLDDKYHFTTARELACIAKAVLSHDLLAAIVSTQKYTIPHPELEGGRVLVNHNKLLRRYEGCIGLKTGYTQKSGRCLVSAACREGVTLIAVTLNAPDDWSDHTAMLDYGFSRYENRTLADIGDIRYPLTLCGAERESVLLQNTEKLSASLPITAPPVRTVTECRRFELAPITKGESYARILFYCDTDRDGTEELIGTLTLSATENVLTAPKRGFWEGIKQIFT